MVALYPWDETRYYIPIFKQGVTVAECAWMVEITHQWTLAHKMSMYLVIFTCYANTGKLYKHMLPHVVKNVSTRVIKLFYIPAMYNHFHHTFLCMEQKAREVSDLKATQELESNED